MTLNTWVLEVGAFNPADSRFAFPPPGRTHLGYLDARFDSPAAAAQYYNLYHPHMRPLDASADAVSDVDPDTHLFCILRRDAGFNADFPPFPDPDPDTHDDSTG